MQSSKAATEDRAQPNYTIWFAGRTRRGTAQGLLDEIREEAGQKSEEIRKLTTGQYASRIITDAAFFLARDLLEYLRKQSYDSDFDRALRYLSEIQSSGVRILATSEARRRNA